MKKISYEEILSIQRKVNIVDVIKDYVPLIQKGRNYFGVCPFHDDHNPSMSVSNEKQMFKCFVCGASGNVFNFVSDYEKIPYYQAVSVVANKIGIKLDISNEYVKKENSTLYEIYDISSKFYQNNLNTASGKIAKNYLKNRSISEEIIKHFQIGLSPSDNSLTNLLENKKISKTDILKSGIAIERENNVIDIYRNRIMFPLWNLNGQVVGFSGRIYDNSDTSKYINTMETEIFKKGNLLYNYHNAKENARNERNIIVVEGFMDVIRLYTIGIENVVATMGTAITKEHAMLLKRLSSNIILMFDGDSAGEKATNSAIEELKNEDVNIKVVRLEENLDPDEYILNKGKEKMIDHLAHATPLFNYKMNAYKKDLDFNDPNDISKYINMLKVDLEKIDDDIVREIEVKKISDLTGVSEKNILSKLDINKKDVKIIERRQVKSNDLKLSKYDKASKYILFYMIKNPSLINYYYNNLSYLPNEVDRKLANEMILFYKKFESFNLNDFIIYLKDKKELINKVIEIDDLDYNKEYDMDLIDSYFKVIKEYLNNIEIEKLKKELKNADNEVVRKEIAKKIVELKIKESK